MDDDASAVDSYGGLRVEPFEGDPWDEELPGVPEAVEASGSDLGAPPGRGILTRGAPALSNAPEVLKANLFSWVRVEMYLN